MPRPDPRRARPSAGFTLTELMTVIVIMGIAAAIALPGFTRTLRRGRANSVARGVIDVFRYARSEAVSRNRAVRIVVNPSATAAGGSVQMVVGPTSVCANLPTPGAAGVDTYVYQASEAGNDTVINSVSLNSVTLTLLDGCFTPSGYFYRYTSPLTLIGTPVLITVGSYTGALTNSKIVSVGPNGSARVL